MRSAAQDTSVLNVAPADVREESAASWPRPWHRRAVRLGLWVLVACLAVRAYPLARDAALQRSPCFAVYYTLSTLLVRHGSLAATYDDATFAAELGRVQPGLVDINVNPPTTALLALPLAGMPFPAARVVWTAVNVALLVVAVGLLALDSGLVGSWVPTVFALAIGCEPVLSNLDLGQAYIAMLALEVVAWLGYRRKQPAVLGVALGFMLALKAAGVLLILLLVAERHWRALAWTAATGAAAVLASLPWAGLAAWRAFAAVLATAGAAPETTITAYQTLPGLIRHLTVPDAHWNPWPLIAAPHLGSWLATAAVVLALGLLVVLARRTNVQPAARFASFATAGIFLMPLSLDYHYVLALLPVALLAENTRRSSRRLTWAALGLAVLLIGANLPYRSPRFAPRAWALLAYPKLYGGMLLCALALWRRPPHDLRQETPHVGA